MFENTNDIIIKGGCFTEETELKGILKYPLNVVYGPNGSGKTTLSRCLASLKDPTGLEGYSASLPETDSKEIGGSVFVFNEDFIDQNVRIKKEGMKKLVIFGEGNQNQEVEDGLEREIRVLEEKKSERETKRNEVKADKEKRESDLKRIIENGYEVDDKMIKGRIKRTHVGISFFDDCMDSVDRSIPLSQLEDDFKTKLIRFQQTQGITEISWERPVFSINPSLIEEANGLLSTILEKDEISDRDMLIFELAQNPETSHYIEKTQNDILNSHRKFCPLCHQPIRDDYREELRHRLTCVLNEKRQHFIAELDAMADRLTEIPIQPSPLPNKMECANEINTIKDKTALLNGLLKDLRRLLNSKKDMLYNIVGGVDIEIFTQLYNEVSAAYDCITTAVNELNKVAKARNETQEELFDLNKKIHYLRHSDMFKLYAEKVDELGEYEAEITSLTENLRQKKDELTQLRMKRANTRIALERINKCLAYVFCNTERLVLENDNDNHSGTYVLKSKGKSVSPAKVSTGERNIIALAYFFTSIFEKKDMRSQELAPALIVIDDPITSFDYGNRIGVFTLIKWQLQEIFEKSKGSKAIIMSHDQRTAKDLFEIQKQIAYLLNKGGESERHLFNLRKCKLEGDTPQSEYEVELKNIFDYAFADDLNNEQINVTIGNQMRRVLEHYAKTMCNCDFVSMAANTHSYHISDVSFKGQREKFDEIVRAYQLNLSRMVINTESHADGNDYEYFEQRFAPEELQRYAQHLLCFMLDTNQSHLHAFLKKEPIKKVKELHKQLFGV